MVYMWAYNYPFAKLWIGEKDGAITNVLFGDSDKRPFNFVIQETPLIKKAAKQLDEFFNGRRKSFNLPLLLEGTDFQKSVWKALLTIPFGETRSYKEIAIQVGNPKAARAVGMANNRNPISIIVPCHRVIGSNGSLIGYGGGLSIKNYLLNIEKAN